MIEVKFKKLDEKAVIPTKPHKSDVGFDLTVTDVKLGKVMDNTPFVEYHSGIAVELPDGYFAFLAPRNSIIETSLMLSNGLEVIDSGYTGEIIGKFRITCGNAFPEFYKIGDKFAQLIIMPYPEVSFVEAQSLKETDGGSDGFGPTNTHPENTHTDATEQ